MEKSQLLNSMSNRRMWMYNLRNFMETLVDEILPSMLDKAGPICKCERCVLDIKALALNSLQPKYIVTEIGEIYRRFDEVSNQLQIDVMEAIVNAIEHVKNNPRHQ